MVSIHWPNIHCHWQPRHWHSHSSLASEPGLGPDSERDPELDDSDCGLDDSEWALDEGEPGLDDGDPGLDDGDVEPEDGLLEGSDELPATIERSLLETRDEWVCELWPDDAFEDAVLLATDDTSDACELDAEEGVLGPDDWLVSDDGGSEDCVLESLAPDDGLPDAEGALEGGGDEPRLL